MVHLVSGEKEPFFGYSPLHRRNWPWLKRRLTELAKMHKYDDARALQPLVRAILV
jgi:hypothetical protein